jgi:hypothetical protein
VLLYLVKHSRPDISNSVRALSKVADVATEAHFKALLRTDKYVIDTEHLGLLLQSKMNNDSLFWKAFLTVNTLEILTHILVYMTMFYILV